MFLKRKYCPLGKRSGILIDLLWEMLYNKTKFAKEKQTVKHKIKIHNSFGAGMLSVAGYLVIGAGMFVLFAAEKIVLGILIAAAGWGLQKLADMID